MRIFSYTCCCLQYDKACTVGYSPLTVTPTLPVSEKVCTCIHTQLELPHQHGHRNPESALQCVSSQTIQKKQNRPVALEMQTLWQVQQPWISKGYLQLFNLSL